MKAVGIIVEYNPFHNGHIHHIAETKRISNADILVAVMSTSFNMRGEIAPYDKFLKTEIALKYGIDLIIELPFIFTNQSSELFAYSSIYLLDKLGIDEIYFGSESNDIRYIQKMARLLDSKEYNETLKKYLSNSYPMAHMLALQELNIKPIASNDMLGIDYVRAISKLNSKIIPHTIHRINSNYNDLIPTDNFISSARAIRNLNIIESYVPNEVNKIFINQGFIENQNFFELLRYKLLFTNFNDILGFDDNLAGLFRNTDIHQFNDIEKLVSKKYTRSRINRLLLNILFDIKKDYQITNPSYLRVLGMNNIGQLYLNKIKKQIDIPLIVKVKEGMHRDLDLEINVSRFYSLVYKKNITPKEFEKPLMKSPILDEY